jgi:hypothetical protein
VRSNKEKTIAAGAQMWQLEMFTEGQLVVWEDILHREVAGAEAILGNDSKTVAIQGGSATCTKDSSSRRGR